MKYFVVFVVLIFLLVVVQDVVMFDFVILLVGFGFIVGNVYGCVVIVLIVEDIQVCGIVIVQDVLCVVLGVLVSSSGSSLMQICICGVEVNYILILIDGIEVVGGVDEYILFGFEIVNIDWIEVLCGL